MITEQVRILLVEDDEDDFILTKDVVSKILRGKFHLEWANTFQRGLEMMAANRHDVYLVDYHLGAQNGIALLQQAIVRGCQSPIILLTGQGEHEIDMAAMKAGAADYLVKAKLEPGLLERSIRHALERKRAEAVAAFEHGRLAALARKSAWC